MSLHLHLGWASAEISTLCLGLPSGKDSGAAWLNHGLPAPSPPRHLRHQDLPTLPTANEAC